MGSRSEEGKEGPTLLVAQATEHTPVRQSKASPWWPVATPHTSSTWASAPLSQGPPALPPAHPVGWHCPCSPDEDTKAPGEGRAEPHWPGYSVLCSDGGTAASPCPSLSLRREGSAVFLHSIQVIGQEHSLPLPGPGVLGEQGWGAPSGAVGKGAGQRGVPVWLEQGVSWSPGLAGGTGGARGTRLALRSSAAAIDAQALDDFLTAQRAGPQWLAALLAAADVAAVEEDHVGLPFQAHDTF